MAILKDLIVHGSSRFLNKIYASEIETPFIKADEGIFTKLIAKDLTAENATVVGLLDVQGQLHTNTWSNSNIATIDGSFYITPTIGSDTGTVAITATSLVFSGTNYAVSSLYLADNTSITWPRYSKVLVSGQILSNGEWIPLGTLLGSLNAAATATSININGITDNRHQTSQVLSSIVADGTTSSEYRNLKISLYQRAASSTDFRPLGIFITAMGTNGKTFLDIYGGVNTLTTTYGGYADPNVRIGNLSGLPSVGNQNPNGWGIYTTNGYFKGTVAANKGYIGDGTKYWVIANDGNNRSYIYNGTNSISSTSAGVYLGTDGIRNYKDSTHLVTIKDGVITALGVDLSGKITASSGSIAGWRIESTYLASGSATGPGSNVLLLSPSGTSSSYTVAGEAKSGWMITAGSTFGVNKDGGVYATSGKIGGFTIGTTSIKNTKTSYSQTTNDGVWLGTDGIGLGKGTFYVTNAGSLTATSGSIAGWSFNSTSLYKTNATPGYSTSTMVLSTGTNSSNAIGGSGTTSKSWMISAGTGFGVTTAGAVYANSGKIGGWTLGTSYLCIGNKTSYNSSNEGLYLGTDYIAGGAGEEWWLKKDGSAKIGTLTLTAAGVLSVPAASITDKLTASQIETSSLTIGPSQITNFTNYINPINLSAWFSYFPYEKNDYWQFWSDPGGYEFTNLENGWMHIQYTNSTSSAVQRKVIAAYSQEIKFATDYTFLIEFRNNSSTGGNSSFYIAEQSNCQFWGNTIKENIEGTNSNTQTLFVTNVPLNSSNIYTKRFIKTSETETSSHWRENVTEEEENLYPRGLACFIINCAANSTIDCEVRVSIYEGKYLGDYKPYVGQDFGIISNNIKEINTGIENINETVLETQDDITSLNDSLGVQSERIDSLEGWITIETRDINGVNTPVMVLGRGDSTDNQVSATLTNSRLEFRYGNAETPVAYIAASEDGTQEGKLFATKSVILQDMQFGNWAWYERQNGNMSIKYIGEN